MLLLATTSGAFQGGDMHCDVGVVGGGPAGVYVAWRHILEHPNASLCLFEMGSRVGGRVHSLRKQGPKQDLVVEAGAYRFSPNKTVIHFGNFSWLIYTPITAHLITDALKLASKRYNPADGQYDSKLRKLVDGEGHDTGYLSFVETMLAQAAAAAGEKASTGGFRFLPWHELVSIEVQEKGQPIGLRFANGVQASCDRVVLNVPQRPLLRLLGASPSLLPAGSAWPSVLAAPTAYPLVKLYLYYEDAWWINTLGLRSGHFNNSFAWADPTLNPMAKDDCILSRQSPLPVQGSYHDGDVRCDGPGGACRGFLQTAYMGDLQAVRAYETFHLSGNDSVVGLDPQRPDHAYLMESLHHALIALHAAPLAAANATARVAALRPTAGVLSIWSQRVAGLEAGCHMPKDGPPVPKEELPRRALQPLTDERVIVANEAFGPLECWAEGSLVLAENAAHKLGLGRPPWMPESVYDDVIFPADPSAARPGTTTPALRVPTDLMLVEAGI